MVIIRNLGFAAPPGCDRSLSTQHFSHTKGLPLTQLGHVCVTLPQGHSGL